MPRFVLYNIEYGQGMQGHIYNYLSFWKFLQTKNTHPLSTYLKKLNPDILGVIEIDNGSMRTHHHSMIEHFKSTLNLKNIAANKKYSPKSLFAKLPIFKNQYNALLTHYPSKKPEFLYLNEGTKRLVIKSTINTPSPVSPSSFNKTHKKKANNRIRKYAIQNQRSYHPSGRFQHLLQTR
jgi:hypothetical protein